MDALINVVYYVIPFLILLSVLVFVHEFGHFIVARISGVQVSAFSIGFGKELWGRKDKHGTYWKISAVPLGGYCQFLGDADASSTMSEDCPAELSEEDKKKAFCFQSPWKKLAIVVAGPGFNYLFAVLIYFFIFASIGKFVFPPVVGEVMPQSAALEAGIEKGDRILSVNDHPISEFSEISREVSLAADKQVKIELQRGDRKIVLNVPLSELEIEQGNGKKAKQYMLGIKSVNTIESDSLKLSLPKAALYAVKEVGDVTMTTLRGVGQMLTGKRGGEDVGGILRIAEMTGDISKTQHWLDFIVFMALLSVNLGMINLFPIPVLDGGHVVIYLLEIAFQKKMNEKVQDYLFKFGLSLLVALMIFATWNDIVHLFNRWFNS